jgi:kynurenine formamidase
MRRLRAWYGRCLAPIMLLLAACAASPAPPPTPAPAALRGVDLSHVVRQDVPYPPGEPPTRLSRDGQGRLRELAIGAHTGTLLLLAAAADADVATVDQLSPRDLVRPAILIDARDQAQDAPGYRLGVAEVEAWEQAHGRIPADAMVLLATGWDLRWGDPAAYMLLGADGALATPGFSRAAAALLLNERHVAGLGVDAPGAVFAPASGHALLLEHLTSLEQLPPTGATLVIGALRLQDAQSSPARVIALVP